MSKRKRQPNTIRKEIEETESLLSHLEVSFSKVRSRKRRLVRELFFTDEMTRKRVQEMMTLIRTRLCVEGDATHHKMSEPPKFFSRIKDLFASRSTFIDRVCTQVLVTVHFTNGTERFFVNLSEAEPSVEHVASYHTEPVAIEKEDEALLKKLLIIIGEQGHDPDKSLFYEEDTFL